MIDSASQARAPLGAAAEPQRVLSAALTHFDGMIERCLAHVERAKQNGRPVVGILCEFTPREVIMAAGGVPVCLCGGSADTIPAAERFLPANLCPLIKSTFGYHVTGRNPFLEFADLVIAETTCDGKKKMLELLARDKPVHVLDLPNRADSAEALTYWVDQVRLLRKILEDRFNVQISNDKLRQSISLMNRERGLRRSLANLMQAEVVPFSGRQLLEMKSIVSGLEPDLEMFEAVHRAFAGGEPEAGPAPDGRVRVLLTGVPLVHGAERVVELVENAGATVVCMENCTGLKPILEDVAEDADDPLRAIATKYYHLPCSVMTSNQSRLKSIESLAARFRPECLVELVWQACLTYDIESFYVRQLAEDRLELPYLKICTDYSRADSARITGRLQALCELVRGRRRRHPG